MVLEIARSSCHPMYVCAHLRNTLYARAAYLQTRLGLYILLGNTSVGTNEQELLKRRSSIGDLAEISTQDFFCYSESAGQIDLHVERLKARRRGINYLYLAEINCWYWHLFLATDFVFTTVNETYAINGSFSCTFSVIKSCSYEKRPMTLNHVDD